MVPIGSSAEGERPERSGQSGGHEEAPRAKSARSILVDDSIHIHTLDDYVLAFFVGFVESREGERLLSSILPKLTESGCAQLNFSVFAAMV